MTFHSDPTQNFHHGDRESIAAHDSLKPDKQRLRALVVGYVKSAGGATSDEVEEALGLAHQTVSARLTEAKALGLVVDSGERRKTRSGRQAKVLKVV